MFTKEEINKYIETNLEHKSNQELLELASRDFTEFTAIESAAYIELLKRGKLLDLDAEHELWYSIELERLIRENFNLVGYLFIDDSHTHGRPFNYCSHCRIVLASPDFNGLSKIKAQQAVFNVLKPVFPNKIHAISLKVIAVQEGEEIQLVEQALVKCLGHNHF